jgi:Rieske Fe-S protein
MMVCDCHSAVFDPKDAGKVVDGPTSRPQPVLPLKLADGTLTVAGMFSAPIQFDQ